MLKCKDVIGMFDEYINNTLDKTSLDEFIKHIELCENCKKDFEIYKTYFSDITIENDFAFPNDLNAKIKYKLNDIKKEKKFLFKPKIVLTYATSISFLLLIGIFGSTYMENLKKPSDIPKTAQIQIQPPTATNNPSNENKIVLEAPKATQAPIAKPKSTPPKNAISINTPAPPNNTTLIEEKKEVAVPTPNVTPIISATTPENNVEVSDKIKETQLAGVPTEQPEQDLLFKSFSMERSAIIQKINVEISVAYKKDILQKYSYTEISTDLYNINIDMETLKKDYPNATIINNEFEESFITVQFVELPISTD